MGAESEKYLGSEKYPCRTQFMCQPSTTRRENLQVRVALQPRYLVSDPLFLQLFLDRHSLLHLWVLVQNISSLSFFVLASACHWVLGSKSTWLALSEYLLLIRETFVIENRSNQSKLQWSHFSVTKYCSSFSCMSYLPEPTPISIFKWNFERGSALASVHCRGKLGQLPGTCPPPLPLNTAPPCPLIL